MQRRRLAESCSPLLLAALLAVCAVASPPDSAEAQPKTMLFARQPVWVSEPLGHYATGGAWADIDGDGWLDMVVANGNDMQRQRLVIYHNNGDGTLPQAPTWTSADIDYHGHLDVGDVNGDGLPDVVVSVYLGPAGFDEPGKVKLYLNDGDGGLSPIPDWQPSEPFYSFSLALGDADGDGDLDLACAGGEGYTDRPQRQRIFFNRGGELESEPSWLSDEVDYALDVTWGDVDSDGDLDVVFCGERCPMRIYLNEQTAGGEIGTIARWQSEDDNLHCNTTALGDWDGDGLPELAAAENPGIFKVYRNRDGLPEVLPAWSSSGVGYGSHVSWIDADRDGDLDLAAGSWWGSVRIWANTGGVLSAVPVWWSDTSSVIENLFWGDVDSSGLRAGVAVQTGNGTRTFFPLGRAPVRSVDRVLVDDVVISATSYTWHAGDGWVSLSPPPSAGSRVEIAFTFSASLELGVTNWDPEEGNYLFQSGDVASGSVRRPGRRVAPVP